MFRCPSKNDCRKLSARDRSEGIIGKESLGGKEIFTSGTVTGTVGGRGSPYIKLGLASDNHDERNQSPGHAGNQEARKEMRKKKETPRRIRAVPRTQKKIPPRGLPLVVQGSD